VTIKSTANNNHEVKTFSDVRRQLRYRIAIR